MKAIIFAGIGLFAAATIYGITDFAADKKKGTIDKLYKEEVVAPVAEEKEATVIPDAAVEKNSASGTAVTAASAAKKNTVRKKSKKARTEEIRFIKLDDFSRGRIPIREVKTEEPAEAVKEIKKEG